MPPTLADRARQCGRIEEGAKLTNHNASLPTGVRECLDGLVYETAAAAAAATEVLHGALHVVRRLADGLEVRRVGLFGNRADQAAGRAARQREREERNRRHQPDGQETEEGRGGGGRRACRGGTGHGFDLTWSVSEAEVLGERTDGADVQMQEVRRDTVQKQTKQNESVGRPVQKERGVWKSDKKDARASTEVRGR